MATNQQAYLPEPASTDLVLFLSILFVLAGPLTPCTAREEARVTAEVPGAEQSASDDEGVIGDDASQGSEDSTDEPTESVVDNGEEIIVEEQIVVEEEEGDLLLEDESDLIVDDSRERILDKATEPVPAIEAAKPGSLAIQEEDLESIAESPRAKEPVGDTSVLGEVETPEPEEEKPIVIEKERAIDFAGNLEEYRSPKRAMFLSLLVPGLGQLYARNYVKAGAFLAAEAAVVGVVVKLRMDGNERKKKARRYANVHFDTAAFYGFHEDLAGWLPLSDPESPGKFSGAGELDSVMYNIFFRELDTLKNDWRSDPAQDGDRYYGDIRDPMYVRGWSDCEPEFDRVEGYDLGSVQSYRYESYSSQHDDITWLLNILDPQTGDTVKTGVFGYSQEQERYNSLVADYNKYYKASNAMFFVMLGNHLFAAIDAFITARVYNARLLKEKSAWERIHVDHRVALGHRGIESRFGLRIAF